jgi:ubiquinone/menaquinone biosynthesis C-methylase UbiE
MKRTLLALLILLPASLLRADQPVTTPTTAPTTSTTAIYRATTASADGIGKVYMGREIAAVMGHEASDWLDRPQREDEEKPTIVVNNMDLKETDVVADIGAGTGYFTFLMSPKVSRGKVLAVDIQQEMLDLLNKKAKEINVTNVQTVLGEEADPKLPDGGVDVALMVDAYHEFAYPREMMEAIFKSLKPGGRVVLVEYRGEDPKVRIKPHHKMTEAQAIAEMSAVGLKHVETRHALPLQHMMIFQKPARALP